MKPAQTKTLAAIAAVAAVLLLLSVVAHAASGPSVSRTDKKEEKPQLKAGEVTLDEEKKYKCSSFGTMSERIQCRLQLYAENEYGYLPEECRAQVNESRDKCVADYKKSRQCWVSVRDGERFECAKKSFGLVGTVASQKAVCDGMTGQNRSDCILELRDRVDAVVKFRIYNLEEKAQRLMDKGFVDVQTVTDFVTAMEQQKQNYNDAKTVAEKKEIVKGVQRQWQDFITKVKGASAEKRGNTT